MDSAVIAKSISIFNFAAVFVSALLAICAITSILGRRFGLNFFIGRHLLLAFGAASLLALVLEVTLFNYSHYYSKYNAGPQTRLTEICPEDSTVFLTSDGTRAEIVEGGVVFKELNRKVSSVFVTCEYKGNEAIQLFTEMTDKESTKPIIKILRKHYPLLENYIRLHPFGEVSELKVLLLYPNAANPVNDTTNLTKTDTASIAEANTVDTTNLAAANTASPAKANTVNDTANLAKADIVDLTGVVINGTIPLYFSGLRVLALSVLFFGLILVGYKKFRVKTAYYLFDYKFDPINKKQNFVYAFSAALIILFSWICAYTSIVEDHPQAQQYNKYLVDALIEGRTNLEAGNPEKLLNAERPYDLGWLMTNGYEPLTDWMPDWAYYNGKFYSYFGVVPALALYVPYKMITGNYLSNHGGIFLFVALSIILMARLWKFLVKKYMPNVPFTFYLLSFLALFFTSGLFGPLRFTRFYSIVSAAGFMFTIAGILLLLESVDKKKIDRSKLFFSCLCFALVVGCRPNLVFVSLLVPVILWRHRLWKQLPLIIIPYILVAIPMCLYNHARFGSIFDFGVNYNLTTLNVAAHSLLSPSSRIIGTFVASISYLFSLNRYSFFFPYVQCLPQNDLFFSQAIWQFYDKGCGLINFPIVFSLFYFAKNIFRSVKPKTYYLTLTFLAIGASLMILNSYFIGFSGRYTIDFAIFFILSSLFCAYHWCSDADQTNIYQVRTRQKVTYVLLAFSIFVGLSLFATTITNDATPGSPALYRYLQFSLGVFGTV